MTAEIITIGDEILIGQIVDTNSAWMGKELSRIGIEVVQISSISDNTDHILAALGLAKDRVDIIFITGGLGPTKDDITKRTLAKYFDSELIINAEVLEDVTNLFKAFDVEMIEVNKKQAEVPENCMVLRNEKGTAPGMWFEERGKIYVSMPGVPYEMKSMMKEQVLPKLKNDLDLPHIVMHTVLTQGIGESFLGEKIAGWEEAVAKDGIKLAYLPSAGSVRLRLSITSRDLASAESLVKNHVLQLEKIIPGYIYGNEEEDLPKVVGKLLQGKSLSVSTAESCTGGYIAHLLTQYPGSSAFYKGSMITYSDDIKTDQLAIDPIIIEQKGAVSEDVAIGMAESVRIKMNTDFAISCTGIAGPDGGNEEKPVGTVWIGISGNGSAYAKKYRFGGDRTRNIEITAMTALNMLRKEILKLT